MTGSKRFATLVVATAAAAGLGICTAGTASATIHPLNNGWACGNATGSPPGQSPGVGNHSDTSSLRALTATGVITDLSKPPSKYSTFDPATDTGTPTNPAAIRCTDAG
jgi:hypothetical protein